MQGFDAAFCRFELALEQGSTEGLFVAATESNLWLVAVDEWHERQGGPYAQERSQDPGGQVLRALRWARNQGVHNLVAVHRPVYGMTFPATFPLTFPSTLVWRDPADVPELRKHQPRNLNAYRSIVGLPVRETFLQARQFLSTAKLPGVPRAAR